jgi:hypothetical protein
VESDLVDRILGDICALLPRLLDVKGVLNLLVKLVGWKLR